MKKWLTAILTVTMLITCLFSANAYADETSGTYGDAQWTLENGVLTITGTGVVGTGFEWDMPEAWTTDVVSVVIGEGITGIEWGAFMDCSLSEISFPSTLEYISNRAFERCGNLTSVAVPANVTSVSKNAFAYCTSLQSAVLPANVKTVSNNMFLGCSSLTNVVLPTNATKIGNCTFMDCSALENITLPAKLTTIGDSAFYGCSSLTSVVIPNKVTSIANFTFKECDDLEEVIIPSSVTKIGGHAFANCASLTSIVIPEGVASISEYAFGGCSNLTSITLPASLTSIGNSVFAGCDNLTEIIVSPDNPNIHMDAQGAFYNGDATVLKTGPADAASVVVPETVTRIGELAFENNASLTEIFIPVTVTRIDRYSFWNCSSLTTVNYEGTESQWRSISVDEGNDSLFRANILFNTEAPSEEVPTIEITVQPVSAIAFTGETADFSVEAIGEDLSYQWQYNASGEWNDCTTKTAGYNTATLTVEGSKVRNGYQYRCVITDASSSIITDAVTLTVRDAIIINSQPVSVTADENSNAVFTVAADGFGLSFQWQYKMSANGSWRDSTSVTNGYNTDTLTVVATAGRNNYTYRCIITDMYGHTLTTSEAKLTTNVAQPSVVITQQPAGVSAEEDTIATITVEAEGENLTYLWQYKTATGKDWNDCTGTTPGYNTNTISVEAIARRNGHNYRCVITGPDGYSVTSNIAVLTVVPAGSTTVEDEENSNDGFSLDAPAEIIIASQPTSVNALCGNTAYFSVEIIGGNVSYQWQYKVPGKDWHNSTEATIGYNSEVLAVEAAEKRDGYQYRCIITDAAGNQTITDEVTLTVRPAVSIEVQPVSVTAEENGRAIFSVIANGEELTYQWQYKTPNNAKWRNSTELTIGFDTNELNVEAAASRNGYGYRCIITDANGNSIITDAVTLTIG